MNYEENIISCSEILSFVKDTTLCTTFLIALGKKFTEPDGAPIVMPFQQVTRIPVQHTKQLIKDAIVSSFCMVDSQLCVVICTDAFGN